MIILLGKNAQHQISHILYRSLYYVNTSMQTYLIEYFMYEIYGIQYKYKCLRMISSNG